MSISIRRITADDWREFRAIRLRMLEDTPIAYGETLADARIRTDDEWRERAARAGDGYSVALAAVDEAGRWLGVMSGVVGEVRGAILVGVFVAPEARGQGSGIADALLSGIIDWARDHGDSLMLDVHAHNPRAIAFYRRRGFVETGATHPYELPPYGKEIEMRLDVTQAP
ncbi:GNAT family N-acetyltransferase [Microbacterium sp. G2-8]|uniref:GNAT family N-acetyltransferase n=1 Tax=Microbacterium sp. G2-8 TaxID=2842454 RepID=UPI001C88F090|nr:GNAT family N-acetyltransferase [Microbacterium sp. G2-8]